MKVLYLIIQRGLTDYCAQIAVSLERGSSRQEKPPFNLSRNDGSEKQRGVSLLPETGQAQLQAGGASPMRGGGCQAWDGAFLGSATSIYSPNQKTGPTVLGGQPVEVSELIPSGGPPLPCLSQVGGSLQVIEHDGWLCCVMGSSSKQGWRWSKGSPRGHFGPHAHQMLPPTHVPPSHSVQRCGLHRPAAVRG